jgi:hypothetical protein
MTNQVGPHRRKVPEMPSRPREARTPDGAPEQRLGGLVRAGNVATFRGTWHSGPTIGAAVVVIAFLAFSRPVGGPTQNPNEAVGSARASSSSAESTSTAVDDGLVLTATRSAQEVAPGESLNIKVTLSNTRATSVLIHLGRCSGIATMFGLAGAPTAASGRTWEGISAAFKGFALANGSVDGGPVARPTAIYAERNTCPIGSKMMTLEAGSTVTDSLTWTADLVSGAHVGPGEIPYTIGVDHDPNGAPPSYAPDYSGVRANWFPIYRQLTIDGTLMIAGIPDVLLAAEAIDDLLASDRFMQWLSEEPETTWSNANVFLESQKDAEGIVPAGTAWEIELFRERGVARSWAIGFVDAHTGAILDLSICSSPCDH